MVLKRKFQINLVSIFGGKEKCQCDAVFQIQRFYSSAVALQKLDYTVRIELYQFCKEL